MRQRKKQKRSKKDEPEQDPGVVEQERQREIDVVQEPFLFCRKLVYDAAGAGMVAAEQCRLARIQEFRERLERERLDKRRDRQRQKEERRIQRDAAKRMREISRPQRLRAARKRYPPNLEIYREQLYLMSELAKMDQEEEAWKRAGAALEAELAAINAENEAAAVERTRPDSASSSESSDEPSAAGEIQILKAKLADLSCSCQRLEQALEVVNELVDQAENTRSQLYEFYMSSNEGGVGRYHGPYGDKLSNPRSVLQALSQQSTSSASTTSASTKSLTWSKFPPGAKEPRSAATPKPPPPTLMDSSSSEFVRRPTKESAGEAD
jgi:chromosome segregation ATPase